MVVGGSLPLLRFLLAIFFKHSVIGGKSVCILNVIDR